MKTKHQNLINKKFYKYKVIGPFEKVNKRLNVLCICDCGNKKLVNVSNLIRGHSKSCCGNIKHGQYGTYHYHIWNGIINRCYSKENNNYKNYGAKGIIVCERWKNLFNFISDIGERPSPNHSIDRIDNNGPYSPENCRWATRKEQQANRSITKRFLYNGRAYTFNELAIATKIHHRALRARYKNKSKLFIYKEIIKASDIAGSHQKK